MVTDYGDMERVPDGVAAWLDYDEDEDLVAVFVDEPEEDERRVLKCLNRQGLPLASQLIVIEEWDINEWDEVYAGSRGDLEDTMRRLLNGDEWTTTWVTSSEDYWSEALHYDVDAWYFPRDAFEDGVPSGAYEGNIEQKFDSGEEEMREARGGDA